MMGNRKTLPLEALVPGGNLYDSFQPDSYASILVRDRVAAMVDAKGTLSLHWVGVDSSHMNITTSSFPKDELLRELNGCVEDTCDIKLSGMVVKEAEVTLFLMITDSLVRMDLLNGKLQFVWRVSTEDWSLTCTDGRGNYIYTPNDRDEINYLNEKGLSRVVYKESNPNFTLRTTPSRQEFGIDKMFFLSPDKRKIAFYRLDDSKVTSYPVAQAPDGKDFPVITHIKYPMAGTRNSEEVQVGLVDIVSGDVVWLKGDAEICYWVGLTWSPDSNSIFCFGVNRRQQLSRLLRFNAESGNCMGEVLREESSKYVEQQHSLCFIDDNRFLFQSRTFSKYNHIYLFDLKSNTLNQITQGNWEVTTFLGYSPQRDSVLYLSTKNTPLNRDFFATRLSDGQTFSLSNLLGTHQVYMDEDPHLWVDVFNSSDEPCVTTLGSLESYGETVVLKRSFNPYETYDLPKRIVGILPKSNPSDDDIYYRITKPKDIKSGERLPVVFYVYGGPHVQLITNSWGSGTKGFEEMMADAGCVVFCIDPHGSDNRGMDFESVIRDDLNGPQMRDYKYALNWLFLTQDYVDKERVAIYGWSFGGYMTLSMLLRSGFPFKVGVAGGAVVSWRYYETMYTERYMSLDEWGGTSGDHFDHTDVAQFVEHLKCPLLMIHCCEDPVVLPLQLNYFLSELNRHEGLNHMVDCYLYPGHQHNVRGAQRVNLMEKVRSMIFRYV